MEVVSDGEMVEVVGMSFLKFGYMPGYLPKYMHLKKISIKTFTMNVKIHIQIVMC